MITYHRLHFLDFTVNVKENSPKTRERAEQQHDVQDAKSAFVLISRDEAAIEERVRIRNAFASYILQDFLFFFPHFLPVLICDAKELKRGAEALSPAHSTRKRGRE